MAAPTNVTPKTGSRAIIADANAISGEWQGTNQVQRESEESRDVIGVVSGVEILEREDNVQVEEASKGRGRGRGKGHGRGRGRALGLGGVLAEAGRAMIWNFLEYASYVWKLSQSQCKSVMFEKYFLESVLQNRKRMLLKSVFKKMKVETKERKVPPTMYSFPILLMDPLLKQLVKWLTGYFFRKKERQATFY